MQQWPRHNLIASEGLFCTEGAQEMQKAEAAIFCDLCFHAEKDSVRHSCRGRRSNIEPKLVLSVRLSCRCRLSDGGQIPGLSPNCFRTGRVHPLNLPAGPSGPETANRCPVLPRQEPPLDYLYFDGPGEKRPPESER